MPYIGSSAEDPGDAGFRLYEVASPYFDGEVVKRKAAQVGIPSACIPAIYLSNIAFLVVDLCTNQLGVVAGGRADGQRDQVPAYLERNLGRNPVAASIFVKISGKAAGWTVP